MHELRGLESSVDNCFPRGCMEVSVVVDWPLVELSRDGSSTT